MTQEVRYHREQAEKCRDLARLTDELRRRLSDMAADHDARARETESQFAGPPVEKQPLSQPREKGIEPLTLSIKDAARVLGLGRTTIYRLIGERQLETVKVGNRTLIKTASIGRLVGQD